MSRPALCVPHYCIMSSKVTMIICSLYHRPPSSDDVSALEKSGKPQGDNGVR